MVQNNYWIDLIGFDVNDKEKTVDDFIALNRGRVDGIYLLIGNTDFALAFKGMDTEYNLKPGECSYGAHKYSDEREIQVWTNYDLRELVKIFHDRNIVVYFTLMGRPYNDVSEDGNFYANHKYLDSVSTQTGLAWKNYNLAKRFKDGSYFHDFFAKKIKEVLLAYDFDGFHIADGLSHTKQRIVNWDFGDDLVEQFLTRTGIKLPEKYLLRADGNKKALQERYRYIIANLRYEWTIFVSERYGEALTAIMKEIKSVGKGILLNNANTCSPFESLYAYGVDYRLYAQGGVDKIMFEDACATAILGWRNNEIELDDETRWNFHFRLMEKQGAIKACVPNVEMINMTSIHDVNEHWDIIQEVPNEYKSAIARRSNNFVWKSGKLLRVTEGSSFCLSDGLSQHTWDYIHDNIDMFDIGNPDGALGFTALYDQDLHAQLKEFISTRRHNAGYNNYKFTINGLSVVARASAEEIPNTSGPLFITAEAVRSKELKDYLNTTDRYIIVAGYVKVIDKIPSAQFICGDYSVRIYNADKKADTKVYSGYKTVSTHYQDPVNCHWPVLPRMDKINKQLFIDASDFAMRTSGVPYGISPTELKNAKGKRSYPMSYKKGDYKIFTFKTGKNRYSMMVQNSEHFKVHPFIKFPFEIKKVRIVGMPEWATPDLNGKSLWSTPTMRGEYLSFAVNPRSSMRLEIEV